MLKAQQATFIGRKREGNLPNGLSAVSIYPLIFSIILSTRTFYTCSTHHDILLPKSSCATAHNFSLADELSIEFGPVEGEIDVEVDAIEGTLGCIHAFKVLFEVLS